MMSARTEKLVEWLHQERQKHHQNSDLIGIVESMLEMSRLLDYLVPNNDPVR